MVRPADTSCRGLRPGLTVPGNARNDGRTSMHIVIVGDTGRLLCLGVILDVPDRGSFQGTERFDRELGRPKWMGNMENGRALGCLC